MIYQYTTIWTLTGTITPSVGGENAGWSVSLNAAGDRVAIGCPYNDTVGTNAGRVLIYKNNSGTWTLTGTITPNVTAKKAGWSVSLNAAGDCVAIGAPDVGIGQGYIYKYIYPDWILIQQLSGTAFDTGAQAGFSVSLNQTGDVWALGAPYYGTNDTGGFSVGGTPFYNIAIGDQTGNTYQDMYAVGIGYQSGVNSQGLAAVAIGYQAGQTQQGFNAVAIGYQAGQTMQGSGAIAIGYQAGLHACNAIAIGYQAGLYKPNFGAIAIGYRSGCGSGGTLLAGLYSYAISIGNLSGQSLGYGGKIGESSILIGYLTYQGYTSPGGKTSYPHTNTIVLNASGSMLSSGATGAFHVKPIRSAPAGSSYRNLLYDISFNEIVWNGAQTCSKTKTFIIDHPDDPPNKYLVHACLEGPEAGVFYRGKGTIQNNNSAVITLPQYVRKLAYDFTVQLTPIRTSLTKPTQLTSSKVIDGLFTVYGANGSFFWLVYAKRQSIQAEMPKSTTKVYGNGPYKYHL